MSWEMNFEMYVGAREQRAKVLEVAKRALAEKGYETFANNIEANKHDHYLIEETTCFSPLGDNFDDAIATIYTAVAKELPEVEFKGFSGYAWGSCEAGHCFDKSGNILKVETILYEGCGFCPECGEEVVHVDDYDPAKTYYCPDCGEQMDNEELFSLYEKASYTYEIINGELVEK